MQLEACQDFLIPVHVFTNDRLNNSSNNIFWKHKLFILENSFIKRFFQVFNYLKKNRGRINHVEIYPGGRFIYIYLLLIKLFKLKTITVERGELIFWNNKSALQKSFLKLLYKKTNLVWYREIYMKEILNKMKVKRIEFNHNCCRIPANKPDLIKTIDFLWVNRVIKERKVDWFIKALAGDQNAINVIVGDIKNNLSSIYSNYNLSKFEIKGYSDPTAYYLKSKFFVLPADIVYANNALLEAMSHGIVPLVSDVTGSNLIVNHLENGYVFEHSLDGFKKAIQWAKSLDKIQYAALSNNAIKKIKNDFSYNKWKDSYQKIILSL